jgi:regulator of RNase E activity RraA
MTSITTETLNRLMRVSTATLTTVLFKRGLNNTFLQNVSLASQPTANMVGRAFTLRYIPAREDIDTIEAFNDRSHPQRAAIEQCNEGDVLVMDSRGDPSAASSGNLLLARLWKRGVAGVITDGGFRDSPEIALMPLPAYHQRPSAPTNLIKHHAVDLQQPIGCGGVAVYPGDVMVGDAEGVVCIPANIADAVAQESYDQTIYEDWVAIQIDAGASLFGTYPLTDDAQRLSYQAWRASNLKNYPLASH